MTTLPKAELQAIVAQPLTIQTPTLRDRFEKFFVALVDQFRMNETVGSTYYHQSWSTDDGEVRLKFSYTSNSFSLDYGIDSTIFIVLSSHRGTTAARIVLDGDLPVDYLNQLYHADQKASGFFMDALRASNLPKLVEQFDLYALAVSAGKGPIYAD